MAGQDDLENGSRYVSHARLADVMDRHRSEEQAQHDALAARLSQSIDRKARAEDVQRLTADVGSLTTTVNTHDDQWQRMAGMVSLAKVALGTSVVGTIASLVAIVAALR